MKRLVQILAFFALACPALADPFQFRTLAWDEPVSDLYYSSANRNIPLTAGPNGLSPSFALDRTPVLRLYRLDADGTHLPAGGIPIPSGLSRAILVIHVGTDGACRGKWLDDSVESTPAGAMRIYNFSTKSVALGMGKDSIRTLAPGMDVLTHFPREARAIPIRLAAYVDAQWKVAMNISQPVRARLRFVILIRDGRPALDAPTPLIDWLPFSETVVTDTEKTDK